MNWSQYSDFHEHSRRRVFGAGEAIALGVILSVLLGGLGLGYLVFG